MEPSTHPVVLAAVDLSEASEFVVDRAARQADVIDGQLQIVHVVGAENDDARHMAIVQSHLQKLVAGVSGHGRPSVKAHTYHHARAWQGVVEFASLLEAEMIVLGTHGRVGLARLALGSVAEMVLRHAHCAVLIDRPRDHGMYLEAMGGRHEERKKTEPKTAARSARD